MTTLTRSKTSEAVADYLVGEFLEGRLRPGDRIDLDSVAEELGVSRAPVREALILLERDGTVRMPFHRGAFMGEIGADAVREGFTLYALLSGLTAQLATSRKDELMLASLEASAAGALESRSPMEYEQHAREFRRVINLQTSGPHLRAMLRTFNGLVLAVSKVAIGDGLDEEQELLRNEMDTIRSGNPAAAAAAAMRHVHSTGRRGIDVLIRRGVIDFGSSDPGHGPLVPSLDALLAVSVAATEGAR